MAEAAENAAIDAGVEPGAEPHKGNTQEVGGISEARFDATQSDEPAEPTADKADLGEAGYHVETPGVEPESDAAKAENHEEDAGTDGAEGGTDLTGGDAGSVPAGGGAGEPSGDLGGGTGEPAGADEPASAGGGDSGTDEPSAAEAAEPDVEEFKDSFDETTVEEPIPDVPEAPAPQVNFRGKPYAPSTITRAMRGEEPWEAGPHKGKYHKVVQD